MYTESEARELVIRAGLELLEKKLIARTYGNISARISETQFVITPSGRTYDSLKPEDLVIVNVSDCSYEGDIKPSSEKAIHAGVYLLRSNANFVIHTHQHYASAVCAEEKNTPFAPCAAYALPGSKALAKNVMTCVGTHSKFNAFLLAKHGTLCFGESYEEAMNIADQLEVDCRRLFVENSQKCKDPKKYKKPWIDDYAQLIGSGKHVDAEEDQEAVEIIIKKNRAAAEYVSTAKPLSFIDAKYQRAFYLYKYSKLKNSNKG